LELFGKIDSNGGYPQEEDKYKKVAVENINEGTLGSPHGAPPMR
jgi:hypothetical protein